MSYMENMMEQQFQASEQQQKDEWDELEKDIQEFIDRKGYIWTLKDIFEEYRYYKKGFYSVSSSRTIFKKFEDRLTRLVCY